MVNVMNFVIKNKQYDNKKKEKENTNNPQVTETVASDMLYNKLLGQP